MQNSTCPSNPFNLVQVFHFYLHIFKPKKMATFQPHFFHFAPFIYTKKPKPKWIRLQSSSTKSTNVQLESDDITVVGLLTLHGQTMEIAMKEIVGPRTRYENE